MKLLLTVLCLWLVACADQPSMPPPLDPVSVSPAVVYAGDAITIRSQQFRLGRSIVPIFADTITLHVIEVRDGAVVARVPELLVGQVTIRVGTRNGTTVGSIDVKGFRSYTRTPYNLVGHPYAWQTSVHASVIAALEDRRLVQFFPGRGQIRTLVKDVDLSNSNARSVGPTFDPSVLLVQSWNSSSVTAWRFQPESDSIRSFPIRLSRILAQFNDSIFFVGTHHWINIMVLRGDRVTIKYTGTYEETNGVYLSPRGDVATIHVHGSPTGPPVFSMQTGDTLYHLQETRGIHGAHFSVGGDTLFVLGYTVHDGSAMLLILEARTGRLLQRVDLPIWIEDMAVDPDNGNFYFAHVEGYRYGPARVHMYVMDPRTYEFIGHATAARAESTACFYRKVVVGIDGAFFICGDGVWRFDRR